MRNSWRQRQCRRINQDVEVNLRGVAQSGLERRFWEPKVVGSYPTPSAFLNRRSINYLCGYNDGLKLEYNASNIPAFY